MQQHLLTSFCPIYCDWTDPAWQKFEPTESIYIFMQKYLIIHNLQCISLELYVIYK